MDLGTFSCPSGKLPPDTSCPILRACALGSLPGCHRSRSDHLFLCHLLWCLRRGLTSVSPLHLPPPPSPQLLYTDHKRLLEGTTFPSCTSLEQAGCGLELGMSESCPPPPPRCRGPHSNRPSPCLHGFLDLWEQSLEEGPCCHQAPREGVGGPWRTGMLKDIVSSWLKSPERTSSPSKLTLLALLPNAQDNMWFWGCVLPPKPKATQSGGGQNKA